MIWFLVILIVVVIFKFVLDKNNEVEKINRDGGFINKYAILVEGFLDYPNSRILIQTENSIEIGLRDNFANTTFTIIHTFNKFVIVYQHQSYTFGEHKLNWEFPEYMNQNSVLNIVRNEIEEYNQKIFNKVL